jgi:hypothetical protein
MRVGRDPADVRGPRSRRKAPGRPRRQLLQGGQLAPRLTVVVAAKERARLGTDVDGTVGSTHRDREHTRRSQLAIVPRAPAVAGSPNTAFTEARVDDVGVAWINRKALRSATAQRKRHLERAVAFVEACDAVPSRGVQPSHVSTLGRRMTPTPGA